MALEPGPALAEVLAAAFTADLASGFDEEPPSLDGESVDAPEVSPVEFVPAAAAFFW